MEQERRQALHAGIEINDRMRGWVPGAEIMRF
jgi:hypothetical protein